MTNIDVLLGRGIADQRRLLGLSRAELARKLHVSEQTVSALEEGQRRADAKQLFQIADILGIDIPVLFTGVSDEPFEMPKLASPFGQEADTLLYQYEALSFGHRSAVYAFLVASQTQNKERPC